MAKRKNSYTKASSNKTSLLFLHGAGKSNKSKTNYLSEFLEEKGFNSINFDFYGHGKSEGKLEESSLKHRTLQALNEIPTGSNLNIIASSMSGYTALKLLEYQGAFKIENIILFCPALYDQRAYELAFNNGFSEIIREHESWKNTDVLENLEKFTGNLLIVIGEEDEVIPTGVIELLDKHSSNTREKEIIKIPECKHQIHRFLQENPKWQEEVKTTILSIIQT